MTKQSIFIMHNMKSRKFSPIRLGISLIRSHSSKTFQRRNSDLSKRIALLHMCSKFYQTVYKRLKISNY